MTRLTVPEARGLLRDLADVELAEERERPPCWAPFTAHHAIVEVRAAAAAARTRVEHLLRLADAPPALLEGLLSSGWDPRCRQ